MQALVPIGTANPNDHTEDEIRTALVGAYGSRYFTFRYELLTSANVKRLDLDNVIAGKIEQNWLADIKRKATFTVKETGEIDFLSERIKPWVQLHLPPYGVDDYVEWPQGVFLLSSPTRTIDETDRIIRDVEAFDALQLFVDDKVTTRYTVASATAYTTAISTLLGSIDKNITTSTKTLPVAMEWEPGTSKLAIINDLCNAINYESLSFDESGVAIVKPYVSPANRTSEWTYADDSESLIVPDMGQTLDLFSVANQWTLVVSDPDRSLLTSTYTNNDPSSLTSTARRGRTIVDFRTEQDAADQATLDAKVARLAFEASQIYESVDLVTGMNPIHSGNDVYTLQYGPMAINTKYAEQAWSMNLVAGATMSHTIRRVVTV